jgi:hypothetical protein
MSKKGKAKITNQKLYFDCHEYGVIVYSVKVDVETPDYSYGEVFVFDAYSGNQIN